MDNVTKILINNFKRVEETSQFNEDFTKIYKEDREVVYFIEADVQYPQKLLELYKSLPFFSLKE